MRKNPFEILGITPEMVKRLGDDQLFALVRSNYRALQKILHPDANIGKTARQTERIHKQAVEVIYNIDEAIQENDVLNVLRIQLERKAREYFPSIREYATFFGITEERLEKNGKDILIMHPGPINRGVELSSAVADGLNQIILKQVTNGVAIRMAVLYLLGTMN